MDEYKSRGYHIEGKHVEYWIFAFGRELED
jgi:hypothetical protein